MPLKTKLEAKPIQVYTDIRKIGLAWLKLQRADRYSVRESFCHQTGPVQKSWADTWWTRLLVRLRFFFILRIVEITKIGPRFKGRVVPGKQRPVPWCGETNSISGRAVIGAAAKRQKLET